ncbi:MAG TPA: hypothetical protein V6D26_00155 [Stenomitos sp.]
MLQFALGNGNQLVRVMGYAIASIAPGATVEQLEWQEAEFNELRRLL